METGTIPIDELAGGLDLYRTLESGQSYLWRREDGEMYTDTVAPGAWYSTVVGGSDAASGGSDAANGSTGDVIRVRIRDGDLERGVDDRCRIACAPVVAPCGRSRGDRRGRTERSAAPRGVRGPPRNATGRGSALRLPDLVYLLGPDARRTDSHDGLDAGPRVRRRDRFRRRDVSRVSDAGTARDRDRG